MFDLKSAEEKLAELINAEYHVDADELVIVREKTIEKNYGWIFFYDSKAYLRTMKFSDRLAGNGPVAFEKESGLIRHLGSHAPPEELIRDFETNRTKGSSSVPLETSD